jgi:hemerythrin superfamily protein
MSFIDKIAAAIMPPESDDDRANARRVAEALAGDRDWLAMVLDQHRQIEAEFAEALSAASAAARMAALQRLATILTGHSNAEESVLYPALADIGEKASASMAYEEQAMTKIEMAKLEQIDPMSKQWSEKLEHVRGAVAHHVFQEEGHWFPELQQHLSPDVRGHLTARFTREFDRYTAAPVASNG